MNGALLVNKHAGVSSFGIIDLLQRQLMQDFQCKKRDLPKLGHGGTLDPFATGLLVILVGRSVKLARYFLGSNKTYEGIMRFGETTIPGDPTAPITETCAHLPESLASLQEIAHRFTLQPYLQTPPMHSAKKLNGKPLYELARAGIEVEREPKLCHLYEFDIQSYSPPKANFELKCSSGTYVRTLTQDLGKQLNSLALLENLRRTCSGVFYLKDALTTDQIAEATQDGKKWEDLPCWVPFDQLLKGFDRAEATVQEKQDILQGKQNVLFNILQRTRSPQIRSSSATQHIAIYCADLLVAVVRKEQERWELERVFSELNF